jgi:predicted small lipoprotein YifL
MKRTLLIISLFAILAACAPKGMLRYPPHRWLISDDRTPIEKPRGKFVYSPEASAYTYVYEGVDVFMSTTQRVNQTAEKFTLGGKQEALNVDNFDETPDSTWFTNRLGRYHMSVDEITKPTNPTLAPRVGNTITILSANTLGNSPTLYIEDSGGRRYIVKFDPPNGSGISTGAEVISSGILKAVGYNTPSNYIVGIDPSKLVLDSRAITWGKYSKVRGMTQEDLETVVQLIGKLGKGKRKVRALATLFLSGEPLGPFSFSGRRYGDHNDLIPHEHRRELRGYRVFSSLINNIQIRDNGTLDTFHRSDAALGYVKHNLFGLSTALGNPRSWDGRRPKKKSDAEKREDDKKKDYDYGYNDAAITLFTLGIYKPTADQTDCVDSYKGISFLPTCRFNPGSWITKQPNEAFIYMTRRDAYWAAKIIMKIPNEAIKKFVAQAQLNNPALERYVARQLITRRNEIGSYWFSEINPLDGFKVSNALDEATIHFDDLAIDYRFTKKEDRRYRAMLQTRFATATLLPWTTCDGQKIELKKSTLDKMPTNTAYTLRFQTYQKGLKWPMPSVDLYIEKNDAGRIHIVGINHRASH